MDPTTSAAAGSATFNGTTGRVITHNYFNTKYLLSITPEAALAGSYYVVKAANSFTVFSTSAADTTQAFEYIIHSQA